MASSCARRAAARRSRRTCGRRTPRTAHASCGVSAAKACAKRPAAETSSAMRSMRTCGAARRVGGVSGEGGEGGRRGRRGRASAGGEGGRARAARAGERGRRGRASARGPSGVRRARQLARARRARERARGSRVRARARLQLRAPAAPGQTARVTARLSLSRAWLRTGPIVLDQRRRWTAREAMPCSVRSFLCAAHVCERDAGHASADALATSLASCGLPRVAATHLRAPSGASKATERRSRAPSRSHKKLLHLAPLRICGPHPSAVGKNLGRHLSPFPPRRGVRGGGWLV